MFEVADPFLNLYLLSSDGVYYFLVLLCLDFLHLLDFPGGGTQVCGFSLAHTSCCFPDNSPFIGLALTTALGSEHEEPAAEWEDMWV